jgi:hypothetical protein
MSVQQNMTNEDVGDEIPLHVYGRGTWRPYLRTFGNKLQISSNATEPETINVTIKIAKML